MALSRIPNVESSLPSSPLSPGSPLDIYDELLASLVEYTEVDDDSNVLIDLVECPLKNKSADHLILTGTKVSAGSFHEITMVEEIDDDQLRTYFFKHIESTDLCEYLAELEGAIGEYYRFIAPRHVPSLHAVYDKNNQYIGVISEEIPFFQPVSKKPLTYEDLDVSFMQEKNLSFATLDEADDLVYECETTLQICHRKLKKLVQEEARAIIAMSAQVVEPPPQHGAMSSFENLVRRKKEAMETMCQAKMRLIEQYKKIESETKITPAELDRYRVIKGTAICLDISYIFGENDLNQNNLSRDGKRIDFDMSEWSFTYNVSQKGIVVNTLRKPDGNDTQVFEQDILRFPNLVNAKPFYWPTRVTLIPEEVMSTIKQFIPVSNNPYPMAVMDVYKKLETNVVFIYHKYAIFLKYVLTNYNMYQKLARLHMRRERTYHAQLVTELLAQTQRRRIENFENTLIRISAFSDFFFAHGKTVKTKFIAELEARNAALDAEIKKLNESDSTVAVDEKLYDTDEKPAEATSPSVTKTTSTNAALRSLFQAQKINPAVVETAFENLSTILSCKKNIELETKAKMASRLSLLSVPEEVELYEKIKAEVVAALELYINPGILAAGGYFRKHIPDATNLITFCNNQKPMFGAPGECFIRLKDEINRVKATIPDGCGFKTMLIALSENQEIWSKVPGLEAVTLRGRKTS